MAIVGFAGVTPMETSVAAVTVRVIVPDTPPEVAVMVVEPALSAVASPMVLAVLLIEATAELDELQVTDAEISFFEPSL